MPAPNVSNVQVRTATIQVSVLMMNDRHMTLSVFRQIRSRDLVNEDGSLAGMPWGFVNYHADKCEKEPEHLHVLWQLGDDLFRAQVEANPHFEDRVQPADGSRVMDAIVRDAALNGGELPAPGGGIYLHRVGGMIVRLTMSPAADQVVGDARSLRSAQQNVDQFGPDAQVRYCVPGDRPWGREILVSASAALRAEWHELDASLEKLDAGDLDSDSALKKIVSDEQARRRRHREARQALAALPQYFISS